MKRNFIKTIVKITGVLFVCTMFASFSPSLDGRAVVADEGVFPEGLFAKTVGYLPGDELSVTNISGNSTIQILVIGALDPSEGVAILLSPEAAAAIGIEKDSNNIVKITKRTGQDERCIGTAVIAKASDIEDFDDFENEAEEAEVTEKPEDEIAENEGIIPVEFDDEDEDEFEEEFAEDEEYEEEDPFDEDEFDDGEEEDYEEEFAEEYVDDEEFEEPLDEDELDEEDEFPFDDEEESEEFEEEPLEYEEEDESEYFETDELDALEESEEPEEEAFDEEDDFVDFEDEFAEEPEDFGDEFAEEYEETFEAEPLESETGFDEFDEGEEEYDAIVLVPADDNPPVVDDEAVIENYEYEESDEVEDVAEVDETYNEAIELSEVTTSESGFDKYIVRSFDDLQKGTYYIQIAVLRDEANIMDVVSKYGKNYPIAIIPKADGNGNYILIGPLNVDEYGAVLARFKAYGYKDAFLRKIK